MARNQEKANTLLNKWVTMKKEFSSGGPAQRRPFLSSECQNLGEAERWRLDIIKEISKKMSEIQNAGLGEHKIRDLNDHINKLLREKRHWQHRIRDLGGADYNAIEPKSYDAEGRELPGSGGYKYFGRAKELPGVRELFQQDTPAPPRRTRGDMYKGITPDYYGYRDEDDGVLVQKEFEAEKRKVGQRVQEYDFAKRQRVSDHLLGAEDDDDNDDDERDAHYQFADIAASAAGSGTEVGNSASTSESLKAHVPVPSHRGMRVS